MVRPSASGHSEGFDGRRTPPIQTPLFDSPGGGCYLSGRARIASGGRGRPSAAPGNRGMENAETDPRDEPGKPDEPGRGPARRAPGWSARLALAAGAILLALVAAEAGLRLFAHLPTTHHRLFCEYDELLGWRKVPGASGWHVTSEYRVLEEFNSRGLRGPEYAYATPEDVYRVLVLGDSFVEGYSVAYEDLFTERLRRMLEESTGRPVEIINAGTGGYSTDQELLFFNSEGVKYAPDLTVVTFYENDPLYNAETRFFRGNKPMFVLEPDGELRLTNVPPAPPRRSWRRRAVDWTLDHVRVARLASLAIRESRLLHEVAVRLGITSPWHPFDRDTGVPFEHTIYIDPPPEGVEHAWRVTEALLLELKAQVEGAGGSLLILYAPSIKIVDGDLCDVLTGRYDFEGRGCDDRAVARRLGEIAARHGLDLLEPTERLRSEAARLAPEGRDLYFPEDGHWTEEANRLVAELLERRIRPLAQRRDARGPRMAERRRPAEPRGPEPDAESGGGREPDPVAAGEPGLPGEAGAAPSAPAAGVSDENLE